ncbi:uncharacterized protein BDR25DRAFT_360572 [Lindgomyces ingoldianus]|uniref:Uncharacterized protein n=1 Tax=Lindgomyces ingoldianus TaxID=673940 RepID=A0ACB6QGK3_9PLEO|nr:uncharacterized protein BDR25DRAFT_360572 [Lindgomyces ingoldianus]KAF2465640.1 hypothetical protein BDR25DRAFT_360572 [Lindgomyces ingoldianus]
MLSLHCLDRNCKAAYTGLLLLIMTAVGLSSDLSTKWPWGCRRGARGGLQTTGLSMEEQEKKLNLELGRGCDRIAREEVKFGQAPRRPAQSPTTPTPPSSVSVVQAEELECIWRHSIHLPLQQWLLTSTVSSTPICFVDDEHIHMKQNRTAERLPPKTGSKPEGMAVRRVQQGCITVANPSRTQLLSTEILTPTRPRPFSIEGTPAVHKIMVIDEAFPLNKSTKVTALVNSEHFITKFSESVSVDINNTAVTFIDMRKARKPKQPKRLFVISTNQKKENPLIFSPHSKVLQRITYETTWVQAEREYLASLLRDYLDASVTELIERSNYRFSRVSEENYKEGAAKKVAEHHEGRTIELKRRRRKGRPRTEITTRRIPKISKSFHRLNRLRIPDGAAETEALKPKRPAKSPRLTSPRRIPSLARMLSQMLTKPLNPARRQGPRSQGLVNRTRLKNSSLFNGNPIPIPSTRRVQAFHIIPSEPEHMIRMGVVPATDPEWEKESLTPSQTLEEPVHSDAFQAFVQGEEVFVQEQNPVAEPPIPGPGYGWRSTGRYLRSLTLNSKFIVESTSTLALDEELFELDLETDIEQFYNPVEQAASRETRPPKEYEAEHEEYAQVLPLIMSQKSLRQEKRCLKMLTGEADGGELITHKEGKSVKWQILIDMPNKFAAALMFRVYNSRYMYSWFLGPISLGGG